MKKYVSLIVCAVLIAVACLITIDGEKVKAGRGTGRDTKVETISEVGEILSNLGASSDDYESATIEIITEMGAHSSSDYSGNGYHVSSSSNASMSRKMTIYYTEDAVYYQIDAQARSSSSYTISPRPDDYDEDDYKPTNMVMDIKGEIYVDLEEEEVYMRFSKFSITNNKAELVPSKDILNKWIDFTGVAGGEITDLTEENIEIMEVFGEYMEDEDMFNGSGNVQTLDSDYIYDLCNDLLSVAGVGSADEDDFKDSHFKVDLSNGSAPKGELYLSVHSSDDDGDYSYSVMEKLNFTVKNINNTVVKFNRDAEIYDIDDFDEDGFLL